MKIHIHQLILISGLVMFANAQENASPRLEILHPKPDMQFWVDRIEVAGKIPLGTQVEIGKSTVIPDDDGLFRHLIDLDKPAVLIPIKESRGELVFRDTIRVFHRNLDHFSEDSVFINNNIPETLSIEGLYPRSGNYYGSEVSLRGRTNPHALLLMNADTIKVYPSGAFATHVQIEPGENLFNFTATLNEETVAGTVSLFRPLKRETLTELDAKSAKPRREHWALAGDHLQLGIAGPEAKSVFFKIPGLTGWRQMNEGREGYYTSSLHYWILMKS